MANVGSLGIDRHIDDPEVSEVNATAGAAVTWALSSDASDTAFAKAVAASRGLHYAGATAATDNNMIEFCSNDLIFAGQQGHAEIEILMQLDDVTNAAFNFGFNDDVQDAGDTLPVELSGTTWTTTASTFIGFVYDVNATNDELHAMWVDDNSDTSKAIADLRFKGMAPTNAKWLYMKVEIDDQGSGNGVRATLLAVDHNGRSVEKTFNTTVDRDAPLCYYFGYENRSASAHNAYIKHCNYAQTIADM